MYRWNEHIDQVILEEKSEFTTFDCPHIAQHIEYTLHSVVYEFTLEKKWNDAWHSKCMQIDKFKGCS